MKFVRGLKLFFVGAFVAGAIFSGCGKSTNSTNGIVIADSNSYEASIFRANCAICHGTEGNGKEINGRVVPSLRVGHPTTLSEEEIYKQIKFGKLPMPGFAEQLSEGELRAMAHFVYADIQGRGGKTK